MKKMKKRGYIRKVGKKWKAEVRICGVKIYVGTFRWREDAVNGVFRTCRRYGGCSL